MEITHEEYLKALEIVKSYHDQIIETSDRLTKTPISGFFAHIKPRVPPSLYKGVVRASLNQKYVEDIDFMILASTKGVGETYVQRVKRISKLYISKTREQ
jgi:hypothetical protein